MQDRGGGTGGVGGAIAPPIFLDGRKVLRGKVISTPNILPLPLPLVIRLSSGASLGISIRGFQEFALHEFDPKILTFSDMKTFFSSKSVGSILHFSEIYGFYRTPITNGTHSNYAPDLMFVPAKVQKTTSCRIVPMSYCNYSLHVKL